MILKTNDLAEADLGNKGLSWLDPENNELSSRNWEPTSQKRDVGHPVYVIKSLWILKIKDLAKGDLENKGLTAFDPENKGVRSNFNAKKGKAQLVAAPSLSM